MNAEARGADSRVPKAGTGCGLVVRAGGIEHVALCGTCSDAPDAQRLTRATRHDLASVTKVVGTTAALMTLVSRRAVAVDDRVSRYLPGFTGGAKDDVTLRDLLQHRAGLWEWQPLYVALAATQAAGAAAADPVAALRLVERLPLRFAPGSGRHYSDLGFMLLGAVVAHVAAMPLDRAVAELVTEPLGMKATRFARPDAEPVATSAYGDDVERAMVETGDPYPVTWSPDEFGGWRRAPITGEVNDGNAFHAFGGVAGHAGLFSTLDDLLRFAEAVAHPEAAGLWAPDVVAEFVAPGPDAEQGLGFRRVPITVRGRDAVVVGHPGFVGCAVGCVPAGDLAVAVVSNRLLGARPIPTSTDVWLHAVNVAVEFVNEERSSVS